MSGLLISAAERLALAEMLRQRLAEDEVEGIVGGLVVTKREIDGAGFITEFAPSRIDSLARTSQSPLTAVAEHPNLSEGAIFTLIITEDGTIDSIEGATFAGEVWPEDDSLFQLSEI
ncbi:hypothetical protein [Arenimonas alkanexedens]